MWGGLPPVPGKATEPFRLDGLVLLSNDSGVPFQVGGITLVFDDRGVEVSTAGDEPRTLPWSSLSTHLVEPWTGQVTPEWWVDPELNRRNWEPGDDSTPVVIDPEATNRAFPQTEPGALISLRTPYATYRFLAPGGRADTLAPKMAELALSHQGPAGAPSATTVASGRTAAVATSQPQDASATTWHKVQPVLVVLLVVFLAVAVTLILLQSAGTIHLPFLGGANPGILSAGHAPVHLHSTGHRR
jgi:hypothetical protein